MGTYLYAEFQNDRFRAGVWKQDSLEMLLDVPDLDLLYPDHRIRTGSLKKLLIQAEARAKAVRALPGGTDLILTVPHQLRQRALWETLHTCKEVGFQSVRCCPVCDAIAYDYIMSEQIPPREIFSVLSLAKTGHDLCTYDFEENMAESFGAVSCYADQPLPALVPSSSILVFVQPGYDTAFLEKTHWEESHKILFCQEDAPLRGVARYFDTAPHDHLLVQAASRPLFLRTEDDYHVIGKTVPLPALRSISLTLPETDRPVDLVIHQDLTSILHGAVPPGVRHVTVSVSTDLNYLSAGYIRDQDTEDIYPMANLAREPSPSALHLPKKEWITKKGSRIS